MNVDLVAYIRSLFECHSTHTPALSLLIHFEDLSSHFDVMEIAKKLVKGNSMDKSMSWIQSLDERYRHEIIRMCQSENKWKLAWTVAKALNLDKDYSHVHLQLRKESIQKLIKKQNWQIAVSLAEDSEELQVSSHRVCFI